MSDKYFTKCENVWDDQSYFNSSRSQMVTDGPTFPETSLQTDTNHDSSKWQEARSDINLRCAPSWRQWTASQRRRHSSHWDHWVDHRHPPSPTGLLTHACQCSSEWGSASYSTRPRATYTANDRHDAWLWLPRRQTETELVICSMVWQSVPPITVTLYLRVHNDSLFCCATLTHITSSSLLPLFFWSFLTCLSSPPSFLVRSDSPAFRAFQLRMLEIPSSCCGLAKSLLLFHPSIPSPILHVDTRLHLVRTRRGRTWLLCRVHLHLPSP